MDARSLIEYLVLLAIVIHLMFHQPVIIIYFIINHVLHHALDVTSVVLAIIMLANAEPTDTPERNIMKK